MSEFHRAVLELYTPLKLKSKVFLKGCIVAVVTYYAIKVATTCLSPMIENLCETYIAASFNKEWLY